MKRFKGAFIAAIVFSFLISSSCGKDDEEHNVLTLTDPISSFSWTGNDGPAPVTIVFQNHSQYADTYEWKFGDNSMPSTVKNPTHTYHNTSNKPKNFTVTLTVKDTKTDKENTRSKVLVVQPMN